MPDPKKKVNTKPKKSALTDTQQISDALAKKVASGKMTHAAAMKLQKARDSKTMKTVKKVQNTTGKGTPKVAGSSHTKARKAKFRRNKKGNVEAY